MANARVAEFLALYNRLDEAMRTRLGADEKRSHANLLEAMAVRDPVFREHHSRLQAYRSLRNSLVHVSWEGGQVEPIAEPSEQVLAHYRMLVAYVLAPPRALDTIATREVFTCTWTTPLAEGLGFIASRNYDTIPILDGDRLAGVYTASALQHRVLASLRDGRGVTVTPESAFELLRDEIAFDERDPHNACDRPRLVELAGETASVEDLEQQFRAAAEHGRFLACVCITSTGAAFGRLLGIVTAHNLPSANARAASELPRARGRP